ncbi:SGNH/GDSL hydrolase family protein [Clostridium oryzae]|uniref:SGNH hydrolase-type esterase domain-containing protein n=1 Tax=Clostridium oryzae TaxID=1450648 RepID=A0A1V4ISM9_9CLOT|nr:SGNH/GDSL hydrolase family protein [Clostridium oryzae]OPJ62913.1 hypothetical protein CLORY_15370 [Clostridium oryzae]
MELNIYQKRSGFPRLLKAIKKGEVIIGFIGGSITDQSSATRWPEYVCSWFVERFPNVRFYIENAAIGGTGSDLAVFRADRDLIDRNCDIVFVEYAVNDNEQETEKRMRSREGLIRKLLKEDRDLLITYTYMQDMYTDMMDGKVPATVDEFEQLAAHYDISSVWMGLYALEEVKKGRMRWEEWLPDGLHPDFRGSLSYAQSVTNFLEQELVSNPNYKALAAGKNIKEPFNKKNWENAYILPFSEVETRGPWMIRRWSKMAWTDQVLSTSAVGAKMQFDFEGTGLMLAFDFGTTASEFKYSIDGQEWIETNREREWWMPESGQYLTNTLAQDLKYGKHHIEIEVVHGNRNECKGTNFRLAFIGVIV